MSSTSVFVKKHSECCSASVFWSRLVCSRRWNLKTCLYLIQVGLLYGFVSSPATSWFYYFSDGLKSCSLTFNSIQKNWPILASLQWPSPSNMIPHALRSQNAISCLSPELKRSQLAVGTFLIVLPSSGIISIQAFKPRPKTHLYCVPLLSTSGLFLYEQRAWSRAAPSVHLLNFSYWCCHWLFLHVFIKEWRSCQFLSGRSFTFNLGSSSGWCLISLIVMHVI